MSSLERKQHADLVRHRELNALRRLMVQRGTMEAPNLQEYSQQRVQGPASTQAIGKIDALEAQMNRELFEHSTMADTSRADFAFTQIRPYQASTTTQHTRTQGLPTQMATSSLVQQAAEQFVQGQTQVAQSMLESAISAKGQHYDHIPTWLVLFDLYRATDQMDRFEAQALEFSIRFGRSPPAWVSLPLQANNAQREHERGVVQATDVADWTSPTQLALTDVVALQAAVQAAIAVPRQLVMDWRPWQSGDVQQWELLASALTYLAEQPVHCSGLGWVELEQFFQSDKLASHLARLALLRCQNRAQAFEDAAIDYSVQFEISPPDWQRPECRLDLSSQTNQQSSEQSVAAQVLPPELYGNLNASVMSQQLAVCELHDGLILRCDRLILCDDAATVTLIRFAQMAKAQNFGIELQGAHRLLAAYFASRNLYDYAKVTLRRD